jgi:1,4-dihydroxy-2-naphthoate polyprenyltransferase
MNAQAILRNEAGRETRDVGTGIWRLADPKISLASAASMFLGACAAAAVVPLDWGWLALTVLGIFAIEVAKNTSGEIFDFDSGADLAVTPQDRTPFSGGKRVLVEGLLTREQTWLIAAACYALGVGIGLSIALWRAPAVAAIGVMGVVLAYQYHTPPLKLSYRGLGELAVALCYGPLIALGTYIVQVRELSPAVIFAALPLGFFIAGFLWVNEFPDYAADKSAGKNTLVVRLGPKRAAWTYLGLVLAAFALIGLLPFFGLTPWMLLGVIGSAPAVWGAVRLIKAPADTQGNVAVQRLALIAFLLTAIGEGAGFLITH